MSDDERTSVLTSLSDAVDTLCGVASILPAMTDAAALDSIIMQLRHFTRRLDN